MYQEWEGKLRKEVMKTRLMFAQSVEEVSQEIHGFYCKMHMDKSLKGIDEELGKCSKKTKK